MAEVVWTERAIGWLQDIYDYIAKDNPAAAICTVEAIYDKARLLAEFPELGYRYERWPERNLRILLYGHYRIAYLIKPTGIVDIIGVFHAALDMDRYLD
jgi:plasmid stabilization system protein ParE